MILAIVVAVLLTAMQTPANRKQYRYSSSWLTDQNLEFIPAIEGTQGKIKIAEKQALYTYYFRHRHLPPGNRIFR